MISLREDFSMKQIHKTIPVPENTYIQRYFLDSHAFFDIETTGFSPKTAFVYLIGLAVRKGSTIHIYQFFAENRKEEAEVINCFYQKLCQFSTIITFNGKGFDIPFLKAREEKHGLKNDWEKFESLDLYKAAGKLANILKLPNKKQKTIEQFLGIEREDLYTGGDLIQVYFAYEKKQDTDSKALLLLHNYEDVLGMTKLLPLLSYFEFLESPVQVSEIMLQENTNGKALFLILKAPIAFPKQILYRKEFINIKFRKKDVCLYINVLHDELRFYFENYKDYYYLPEEDMAIHKSVAAFVDSSHKKKATAATCYSKHTGDFLPQAERLFTPCFYLEKKTKHSYFELKDNFTSDSDAILAYASHLLNYCYSN